MRREESKQGGTRGSHSGLSTLTWHSVIECSFPVTGPAQRGPFMGSPARPPGNQATVSAPGPLNSSSKPLNQQLRGSGEGQGADSRPGDGSREGGPQKRREQKRGGKGKPSAFLLVSRGRDSCTRLSRRWKGTTQACGWAWRPCGQAGRPHLAESRDVLQGVSCPL